jgi:hypothetical protein
MELNLLDELKARDARPAQAQASLDLFILNFLPNRQRKSFGFNEHLTCYNFVKAGKGQGLANKNSSKGSN